VVKQATDRNALALSDLALKIVAKRLRGLGTFRYILYEAYL